MGQVYVLEPAGHILAESFSKLLSDVRFMFYKPMVNPITDSISNFSPQKSVELDPSNMDQSNGRSR